MSTLPGRLHRECPINVNVVWLFQLQLARVCLNVNTAVIQKRGKGRVLFPDIIEIELRPIQKQAFLSAAPEKQASLCQKGKDCDGPEHKAPCMQPARREAPMPAIHLCVRMRER